MWKFAVVILVNQLIGFIIHTDNERSIAKWFKTNVYNWAIGNAIFTHIGNKEGSIKIYGYNYNYNSRIVLFFFMYPDKVLNVTNVFDIWNNTINHTVSQKCKRIRCLTFLLQESSSPCELQAAAASEYATSSS